MSGLDAAWSVDVAWWWLALAAPAAWAVRWVYERTRPGVPPSTQRALWVLRAAALALVLLLMSEPLLSYLARHAERPAALILVDTSASMGVTENGSTRLAQARQALDGDLGKLLGPVPLAAFAERAWPLAADSLSRVAAAGAATDLGAALTHAARALPAAGAALGIVLLSDGRHNLGTDPVAVAADLGVPVLALGIGADEAVADVQLLSAAAPAAIFDGQPASLQATVRSWGFDGAPARITVTAEGEQLAQQEIRLGAAGHTQTTKIDLSPLPAGPHILQVAVEPMTGEITTTNNQRLSFLHVRRQRLRVLLVASAPGAEAAFLRRALEADSTLSVTSLFRRDTGSFYEPGSLPPALTEHDAVVLVDPDDALVERLGVDRLQAYLRDGRGLMVLAGARTAQASGRAMAALLPVTLAPSAALAGGEDPVQVTPSGAGHPAGRQLAASGADPGRLLPPLAGRMRPARAAEGATVLLQTPAGDPVLVAGRVGAGRVLTGLGTGFWRLDFHAAATGAGGPRLRGFWQAAVRWLAASTATGRVRASAERPVFRAGEPATVLAEVFDELNEPLGTAQVHARLRPGAGDTAMEPIGAGRFQARWTGLEPGDYRFTVEARHNGQLHDRSQGGFVVEPHSVESTDLRADAALLAEVAAHSGGDYRPLARWRELADRLRPAPRLIRQERRLTADVDQPLWLGLCVALLTGEWLLRKRAGML